MPTFPSAPPPPFDGVAYCTNKALLSAGSADVDLGTAFNVGYTTCCVAIVQFIITGTPGTQTSYVVLQGDLHNDGVYVDLAWAKDSTTSGTAVYCLSAGSYAAGAFAQSRATGVAPSTATGSNAVPLPGRLRFVGYQSAKNVLTVAVSVAYKLQGLR